MTTEQDCIFCKIVAGTIPAKLIFEDERAVAFGDINPQAPTHALVIPRKHIASLAEAGEGDESLLGHLLRVAARVAREEGHAEGGYRTIINTGPDAGQTVFHIHVHVLAGRTLTWPPG
ncbi:MAG TPA: histidine triad nucleotide-binding protein [Pyrinomonadaceae bacterium]|jgi:histidine triad (HIT) family protein|nr:histidine triad nucleotide-binding protein [Pyrinomonadaceae bacterium]